MLFNGAIRGNFRQIEGPWVGLVGLAWPRTLQKFSGVKEKGFM